MLSRYKIQLELVLTNENLKFICLETPKYRQYFFIISVFGTNFANVDLSFARPLDNDRSIHLWWFRRRCGVYSWCRWRFGCCWWRCYWQIPSRRALTIFSSKIQISFVLSRLSKRQLGLYIYDFFSIQWLCSAAICFFIHRFNQKRRFRQRCTMVSFFACNLPVFWLSVLFVWPILREVLLSFDCCAAFFEKTI